MRLLFIFYLLFSVHAVSHQGKKHKKTEQKNIKTSETKNIYTQINTEYVKLVKPIFTVACYDCHSSKTNYPWYYKIPGIKQLINSDIAEAKKHIDFSSHFPFKSHETPKNDLISLKDSIKNDRMPPGNYIFLHPLSKLTAMQKKIIFKWINNSLELL